MQKSEIKQGRAKQSKEHNLLMRLKEKKHEVLGFLHQIELPVTGPFKMHQHHQSCFCIADAAAADG